MGETWDFDFGGPTDDDMANLAGDLAAAFNKKGGPSQGGAVVNGRTGRVESPAVGKSKGKPSEKRGDVIDVRPMQVTDSEDL